MATFATTPAYIPRGMQGQIAINTDQVGANYVRVWCTAAPPGSELDVALAKGVLSRLKVYEGDGGSSWGHTFDKGGKYTFQVQEYTKGAAFRGGYQGDTRGAPTETALASEYTVTLHIGQRMTEKIGVDADVATLVVWVWDGTIRGTDLRAYGEKTPAIISPKTDRAAAAAKAAGVTTALAALVDVATTTARGNLSTIVAEISAKFELHRPTTAGSLHNYQDIYSVIGTEGSSVLSPKDLPAQVNKMLQLMRRHFTNDPLGSGIGSWVGTAVGPFHAVGGSSNARADFKNAPLYRSISTVEDAPGAIADMWRAYEAHRVDLVYHGVADATNTLTALTSSSPLLEVHRQYLTAMASLSPTVPPAQSTGAMDLIAIGFKES